MLGRQELGRRFTEEDHEPIRQLRKEVKDVIRVLPEYQQAAALNAMPIEEKDVRSDGKTTFTRIGLVYEVFIRAERLMVQVTPEAIKPHHVSEGKIGIEKTDFYDLYTPSWSSDLSPSWVDTYIKGDRQKDNEIANQRVRDLINQLKGNKEV